MEGKEISVCDNQTPKISDVSEKTTTERKEDVKALDDVEITNRKEKKISWYKSNWGQLLFALITIASFCSLIYEIIIIPVRNYDDHQEIQKLKQENAFLNDTSELVVVLKENKKLQQQNAGLLKNQEQYANLVLQNKQLKDNLEQWKKSYQTLQESRNQLNHNFLLCKDNFDIQREINKLREKIEKNNRDIRNSGFYEHTPLEVKYKILEQDNIQLNNMILKYQDKIQCHNP